MNIKQDCDYIEVYNNIHLLVCLSIMDMVSRTVSNIRANMVRKLTWVWSDDWL